MSWFKSIAAKVASIVGQRPVKLDQRAVDVYRASLLLKCHEWCQKSGSNAEPTQEEVNIFYEEVINMEPEDREYYNHGQINKQIIDMFSRIRIEMDEEDPLSNYYEIGDDVDDDIDGMKQGKPNITKKGSLKESIGFDLVRMQSGIPNAGDGVFIRCHENCTIPAGTVLGLFPGLVHLQEFTSQKDYVVKKLLPDTDLMLMARFDGHIIDGRTANECAPNPYGLAHLVNHVPSGGMPNVLQYPYDFAADPLGLVEFPKRLRKYIPNAYARKPTLFGTIDRSAYMHSVILLAARPFEGVGELLMDYRLNPAAGELPSWYSHFDQKSAKSRWE